MIDLTLTCPTCGQRADMCFDHGDDWKKRTRPVSLQEMTEAQLRAGVNEFTQDDPPPYIYPHSGRCARCLRERDDLFWHAQDRRYYCADVFRCEARYVIQGEREEQASRVQNGHSSQDQPA